MSRPANTYDNAACESFLKTIKREGIYASTYRDFEDLENRLEEFIERYYNRRRLHSALGYCSPANFEEEAHAGYGTVIVRGTGGTFETFDKIAHPNELRRRALQQTGSPASA